MSEEVTLPKATVLNLIKSALPADIKCSTEARDYIIQCCVEFINLVTSEAQEALGEAKNQTINQSHIIKSLTDLGFESYIATVQAEYELVKEANANKPKSGRKKLEDSGMSMEELKKQQEELFRKSRESLKMSQQNSNQNSNQNQQEINNTQVPIPLNNTQQLNNS